MSNNEDQFYRHVGPYREALEALVGAGQALRSDASWLPAHDSRAMSERAAEGDYATELSPRPATEAHNLAQLLLAAGEDHSRALAGLYEGDPAPVFAQISVARAALEAFGRAFQLVDPEIATELRIARGRNERINGLRENRRLYRSLLESSQHEVDELNRQHSRLLIKPSSLSDRELRERNDELAREIVLIEAAVADTEGRIDSFTDGDDTRLEIVGSGSNAWILEDRPGYTGVVRDLFRSGQPALEFHGEHMYRLYSGVAHATSTALLQKVELLDEPSTSMGVGERFGALAASSQDATMTMKAASTGLICATEACRTLHGWSRSDAWEVALRDLQPLLGSP